MEREVGGGIGMGNTCKPMAVSFQCMTKSTTIKIIIIIIIIIIIKENTIGLKKRSFKFHHEKKKLANITSQSLFL